MLIVIGEGDEHESRLFCGVWIPTWLAGGADGLGLGGHEILLFVVLMQSRSIERDRPVGPTTQNAQRGSVWRRFY